MSSLTIFLTSGEFFIFHDVEIELNNCTFLRFTYVSVSSGETKRAEFYKRHVAGISYEEVE